jgi:hypothetical protein
MKSLLIGPFLKAKNKHCTNEEEGGQTCTRLRKVIRTRKTLPRARQTSGAYTGHQNVFLSSYHPCLLS